MTTESYTVQSHENYKQYKSYARMSHNQHPYVPSLQQIWKMLRLATIFNDDNSGIAKYHCQGTGCSKKYGPLCSTLNTLMGDNTWNSFRMIQTLTFLVLTQQ